MERTLDAAVISRGKEPVMKQVWYGIGKFAESQSPEAWGKRIIRVIETQIVPRLNPDQQRWMADHRAGIEEAATYAGVGITTAEIVAASVALNSGVRRIFPDKTEKLVHEFSPFDQQIRSHIEDAGVAAELSAVVGVLVASGVDPTAKRIRTDPMSKSQRKEAFYTFKKDFRKAFRTAVTSADGKPVPKRVIDGQFHNWLVDVLGVTDFPGYKPDAVLYTDQFGRSRYLKPTSPAGMSDPLIPEAESGENILQAIRRADENSKRSEVNERVQAAIKARKVLQATVRSEVFSPDPGTFSYRLRTAVDTALPQGMLNRANDRLMLISVLSKAHEQSSDKEIGDLLLRIEHGDAFDVKWVKGARVHGDRLKPAITLFNKLLNPLERGEGAMLRYYNRRDAIDTLARRWVNDMDCAGLSVVMGLDIRENLNALEKRLGSEAPGALPGGRGAHKMKTARGTPSDIISLKADTPTLAELAKVTDTPTANKR